MRVDVHAYVFVCVYVCMCVCGVCVCVCVCERERERERENERDYVSLCIQQIRKSFVDIFQPTRFLKWFTVFSKFHKILH